ncbi:MAG: homoserine kinase [Vicinamibacterales bacterium]
MPPPADEGEIVVPGSISNLGPALDTLSVAVELYLRVRIVDVRPSAPDALEFDFVGRPLVGENRIETAFRHARAHAGTPAPGLRVEVRSDIPMRAGLGSSGAATIAGLRLYEAVTAPRPPEIWLALASAIEGHPDNAAAGLLGGLTLSCLHEDGCVTARAWRWPSSIRFVVATPAVELPTPVARNVLPERMSRADAVFNLQRALLFVRALETGRTGDLREALRDRWHQPFRAPLVSGLAEALALEHPALAGVCLCGAGPSVAALTTGSESEVAALLDDVYRRLDVPCTIRRLEAHQPFREDQ